jgi:hypothetical protein
MELSTAIAATALVMGMAVISGHTSGESGRAGASDTAQARLDAREAQRRFALAEHRKRKEDFARRCGSQVMTPAQLEECRLAYRRL